MPIVRSLILITLTTAILISSVISANQAQASKNDRNTFPTEDERRGSGSRDLKDKDKRDEFPGRLVGGSTRASDPSPQDQRGPAGISGTRGHR